MKQLNNHAEGSIAGIIGGVVALLVAIIVGVMIWFKLDAGLVASTYSTLPVGAKAAWNNTNVTMNTVWTLAPIVAIVLIAGIILGIVASFGRGPNA